jgi:hypothetical protein
MNLLFGEISAYVVLIMIQKLERILIALYVLSCGSYPDLEL